MPDPDFERADYYGVLGVTPEAGFDEIRKRYRELVRRYHPDARRGVGSDKQFVRIATAYRVLSDPDRRRQYDLETGRGGTQSSVPHGDTPHSQARASHWSGSEETLRRAERALAGGALHEARTLAEQVLSYDKRNGHAHALIGDIYRSQGRIDEAISMYTIAVQLDPKNTRVSDNLYRLLRIAKSRERDYRVDPKVRAEREKQTQGEQVLAAILVLVVSLVPPFFTDLTMGSKVLGGFAPVSTWTEGLVAVMVVESFLVGLLLALVGVFRRLDDELLYERAFGAPRRSGASAGLYMVVLGALFFYASVAAYVVIGIVQDSFSRSLTVLYAAAFMLTAALAINFHVLGGMRQVMLWGGNVVFLCMLIGWLVGEIFRPGI